MPTLLEDDEQEVYYQLNDGNPVVIKFETGEEAISTALIHTVTGKFIALRPVLIKTEGPLVGDEFKATVEKYIRFSSTKTVCINTRCIAAVVPLLDQLIPYYQKYAQNLYGESPVMLDLDEAEGKKRLMDFAEQLPVKGEN